MEKIKKAYYYIFYKIYKAVEYTSYPFGKSLTEFKTSLILIALEIWLLMSLGIYYMVYTENFIEISISMPIIYIPLIIILGINYYSVNYLDIWKKYNQQFDQLPKKENRLGSLIVFGIVILIVCNLLFSFYCLNLKLKKNHIGRYSPEFIAKEKKEDSLRKAYQMEKLKKIYGEDKKK